MYDGAEMKKRLEEREERWSESLLSHSTSADTHASATTLSPLYQREREREKEKERKRETEGEEEVHSVRS